MRNINYRIQPSAAWTPSTEGAANEAFNYYFNQLDYSGYNKTAKDVKVDSVQNIYVAWDAGYMESIYRSFDGVKWVSEVFGIDDIVSGSFFDGHVVVINTNSVPDDYRPAYVIERLVATAVQNLVPQILMASTPKGNVRDYNDAVAVITHDHEQDYFVVGFFPDAQPGVMPEDDMTKRLMGYEYGNYVFKGRTLKELFVNLYNIIGDGRRETEHEFNLLNHNTETHLWDDATEEATA